MSESRLEKVRKLLSHLQPSKAVYLESIRRLYHDIDYFKWCQNFDNSCTNELNQALKNIKSHYKVLEEMEERSM